MCGIGIRLVHSKKIILTIKGEFETFRDAADLKLDADRSGSAMRSSKRSQMLMERAMSSREEVKSDISESAATATLFAFLKQEAGLEKFTMAFIGFGFRTVEVHRC